ncbi:MAG: hypothetical protein ACK5P7_00850 [Bdellovibrio sp.]|jgi:hypothetical protein
MTDIKLSKKGDREVSQFVGQELLYDYIRGELDQDRVKALEHTLSENRDLKTELERIREGLHYVMDLQKTQVSANLVESIRTPSTYFQVLLQKTKFGDWPEGVKLAAEGLIIGGISLLIIALIPWSRVLDWKTELEHTSITLTEVTKSPQSDPDAEVAPRAESEIDSSVVFEDENKARPSPTQAVAKMKPAESPAAMTSPPIVPTPGAGDVAAAPAVRAAAPDSGKRQGIIYRGTLAVTNVTAVTEKLVELVNTNGGRKAGEVELGWKKGTGSYFHFTLPSANYRALVEHFGTFGALKIQKEPHPRVMPDGIIRLIITVDEKK